MFHSVERIGEGWQLLDIPSRLLNEQAVFASVHIGKQGDNREQVEQSGRNAQDGQVCPLSLGFHTEMSADFVEGDFNLPTSGKPLNDLFGGKVEVSAQERLGFEAFLWIAHDDPADG